MALQRLLLLVEALPIRDFSLHGYNLSDQVGHAAVREYLRRKLKAASAVAEAAQQDLEFTGA